MIMKTYLIHLERCFDPNSGYSYGDPTVSTFVLVNVFGLNPDKAESILQSLEAGNTVRLLVNAEQIAESLRYDKKSIEISKVDSFENVINCT